MEQPGLGWEPIQNVGGLRQRLNLLHYSSAHLFPCHPSSTKCLLTLEGSRLSSHRTDGGRGRAPFRVYARCSVGRELPPGTCLPSRAWLQEVGGLLGPWESLNSGLGFSFVPLYSVGRPLLCGQPCTSGVNSRNPRGRGPPQSLNSCF